jgi:DNA-directed RNA polymerase subunit N (RpoN/RPB10)
MVLYIKCPSCGTITARVQLAFEKMTERINAASHLSEKKKADRVAKLAKILVRDFCCRQRLLTYQDLSEVLV